LVPRSPVNLTPPVYYEKDGKMDTTAFSEVPDTFVMCSIRSKNQAAQGAQQKIPNKSAWE